MTRFRIAHLLVVVLVPGLAVFSGGCVSTQLELSANHPARPGAGGGAASDPAAALGPDRSLHPPASTGEAKAAQGPDGTRPNPYVGHGTIREVGDRSLVIQHEAIPGFMGAMTMSYPVADDLDITGLAAGNPVTFWIERPESGGYHVFAVQGSGDDPASGPIHGHHRARAPRSSDRAPLR